MHDFISIQMNGCCVVGVMLQFPFYFRLKFSPVQFSSSIPFVRIFKVILLKKKLKKAISMNCFHSIFINAKLIVLFEIWGIIRLLSAIMISYIYIYMQPLHYKIFLISVLNKISFNLFALSALLHMTACTAITIYRRNKFHVSFSKLIK